MPLGIQVGESCGELQKIELGRAELCDSARKSVREPSDLRRHERWGFKEFGRVSGFDMSAMLDRLNMSSIVDI